MFYHQDDFADVSRDKILAYAVILVIIVITYYHEQTHLMCLHSPLDKTCMLYFENF